MYCSVLNYTEQHGPAARKKMKKCGEAVDELLKSDETTLGLYEKIIESKYFWQ